MTTNGGRINAPTNTPPVAHKHNMTDVVGIDADALTAGAVAVYDGSGWTTGTVGNLVPRSSPNIPTISSLTTTSYYVSPAAAAAVSVTAVLAPPTTNLDASPFAGAQGYALRWRYEDPALNGGTASDWSMVTSMGSDTSLTWYNARPGTILSVQARVTDVYGNVSSWTSTSTITTYKPASQNTPSTPVVTTYLSGIQVKWDGLDSDGAAMSGAFAYVEVHVGTSSTFTPSASTKVDVLSSAGQSFFMKDGSGAALTLGSTYYVRLKAYDYYGNESSPSTAAFVVPSFQVNTNAGIGTLSPTMVGFNARDIGGITTSVGNTSPASPKAGDIWLDDSRTYAVNISSIGFGTGVMTVNTATAHNLVSGDKVTIAGATSAGNNGVFDVSVTGPTSFQAANTAGVAQSSAAGTAKPYGGGILQKRYTGSAWVLQQIDRQSFAANTITATQIAAGAIAAGSAVIANAAISSAQIADLSVGQLTAGSLNVTADLTANGVIQTGASGARVRMTWQGIFGYNASSANPTFSLSSADGSFVLNSSGLSTGARLMLDNTSLRAYDATGLTVEIKNDGSASFKGTVTGSAITGSSFSTSSTVGNGSTAGVKIDSTGASFYKSTSATAMTFISATTGILSATEASISGTILGSRIVTGSSLTSGARIALDTTIENLSNVIYLYPGYSGSEKPGRVVGDSQVYGTSDTFTELKTRLSAPTMDATGFTSSIVLAGHGGSTGSPLPSSYSQYYGPFPYIGLNFRYSNWYLGIWPRSANNSSIVLDNEMGGLMNSNGYYVLMQRHAGAAGWKQDTYLSSGPGATTYIRSDGNNTAGQIAVASTGVTIAGGLTISGGGAAIAGAVSATSIGTTSGNIVSGAAISATTTVSAAGLTIGSTASTFAGTATFTGLITANGQLRTTQINGNPGLTLNGNVTFSGAAIHGSPGGSPGAGDVYASGDFYTPSGNISTTHGNILSTNGIVVASRIRTTNGYTSVDGDIGSARTGANVNDGVIYLGAANNRYLFYNATTSAYYLNGASLYVQGTNYPSDARVKTNVQDIGGVLSNVLKVRPVSFNRLDEDRVIDPTVKFGVIAQELEPIFPDLVTRLDPSAMDANCPDGEVTDKLLSRYAVDYTGFIALLIKSVQEIDARLTALEGA